LVHPHNQQNNHETQAMQSLNILAICSYSPGRQVPAREALDAILACAVFDQTVSVLFCGEGVGQLLGDQADYTGSDKPLSRSLSALPLYDVQTIYVDAWSLEERGLCLDQLLPDVIPLQPPAVSELLRTSDRLMSF
jgi:tRNA 2-thiouridine synthesizing protein C